MKENHIKCTGIGKLSLSYWTRARLAVSVLRESTALWHRGGIYVFWSWSIRLHIIWVRLNFHRTTSVDLYLRIVPIPAERDTRGRRMGYIRTTITLLLLHHYSIDIVIIAIWNVRCKSYAINLNCKQYSTYPTLHLFLGQELCKHELQWRLL